MTSPSPLFEDTIGAIATAPGRGAIAVVRLSGPAAGAILLRMCPALSNRLPPPRSQRLLAVHDPDTGELLDRALVSWFPAPESYSGEDTAEISTHGGTLGPQLVLDAAIGAGARLAEPGEFTRRAVFNGKLDLLQAEAVADLIDGRSLALRRAAIRQMDRGLSVRIQDLRDLVLRLEALVAYDIDFPDEDEPPVPPERVAAATAATIARIDDLLDTVPHGEMLREGALVVLAGRPNSGKSSLFNALLGTERAIVTDVPGTTRDALEAHVAIEGYPFRLIDTAGLRDTGDAVEKIGIEVARRYLAAADIVLFCAEAGRELDADEIRFLTDAPPGTALLLLRTKADAAHGSVTRSDGELLPTDSPRTVTLSALSGDGLTALREELVSTAFAGMSLDDEQPLLTRARHARALRSAREDVARFDEARREGVPPELATTHLRAAAAALESLVGALTPDDVLGQVFQSFCVGK